MKRICIVGLGNKEKFYDFTRHNFGKDFLNWLSKSYSMVFSKKQNYNFFEKTIDEKIITFIIPETNMNNSGTISNDIKFFFENDPKNLIIIHDDLQIDFKKIKIRNDKSRGLRGHNGLRSFSENLKKFSETFPIFLSLGIGKPLEKKDISNFVTEKFNKYEFSLLEEIFSETKTILENYIKIL